MANNISQLDDATASHTDSATGDVARRARNVTESVGDIARDAAKSVDANRSTAADGLDSAASTLRDNADQLPGGETVRDFAHSTADRLTTGAEYMRTHDARRMMADVEDIVKKNPGPALAVAAAFGFLIGRALSRD